MGASISFYGRMLYTTAALAREVVESLPGRDDDCILCETGAMQVRGAQVDIAFKNVIGSNFYEGTLVALASLTLAAFCGRASGTYGVGQARAERETRIYQAQAPWPGAPPRKHVKWMWSALLDDLNSVGMARRELQPDGVAHVAAVFDQLTEPIQRARLARLLVGRDEPEARRVAKSLAELPVADDDPWGEELRSLIAEPVSAELRYQSLPFLVRWIHERALSGSAELLAEAREKIQRAHLADLASLYDHAPTLVSKARIARVMIGRPRVSSGPDVQRVVSDLIGRVVPDDEWAAEVREIQGEARGALHKVKARR